MALIDNWTAVRKELVSELADEFYSAYGVGNLVALDLAETAVKFTEDKITPLVQERMAELAQVQETMRSIIINISEE